MRDILEIARENIRPPVGITAIHLDAHSDRIRVSVEMNGRWIEILNEFHPGVDGCHTSHIVEAAGIRARAVA